MRDETPGGAPRPGDCPECLGLGRVGDPRAGIKDPLCTECPACGGTGKRRTPEPRRGEPADGREEE